MKNLQEPASFVRQLVRAQTTEATAGIVKDYLAQYTQVRTYEPREGMVNLTATISYGQGPHIILCGHLDTYGADPEKWKYPPFSGKILQTDDTPIVYGRGSTDMKGGIAGLLFVLCELPKEYEGTLTYVFTPDEEVGSVYGTSWLFSEQLIEGDACIIAEPTSLLFYSIGEKGIYKAYLPAECPLKDELVSVLTSLEIEPLLYLQDILEESNQFFKNVLAEKMDEIFVTCFETDGMYDFSVGIPHSCSLDDVKKIISTSLEQNALCTPEIYDVRSPNLTPHDHWLCRALETAAHSIRAESPRPLVTVGSSDASFFREAGIPCVLFGPGEPVLSHSENEWVSVKKVEQLAKIVAKTLVCTNNIEEDSL